MTMLSPAAVMRRWFEEVWNARRTEMIEAYLAPDGILHNVEQAGVDARGPEAFRGFHRRILDAFPDIRFTLHEVIESGPLVAARWSATLTHEGHGLGVPPTGSHFTLTGLAMARVENGQVVESWDEWDRMSLARACGLTEGAG